MKASFASLSLLAFFVSANVLKQGISMPEVNVADGYFVSGGLEDEFSANGLLEKRACTTCYPWSCDGHCCQFDKYGRLHFSQPLFVFTLHGMG